MATAPQPIQRSSVPSGVAPEATLREGQQHGGVNIVPSTRSTGGEIPVGTLAVPRKQGNG
jgi:hypothetical protein